MSPPPPSLGNNNYLDSIDGRNNGDENNDENNDNNEYDNDNNDYDNDYDGKTSSSSGRFRNNDGRPRGDNNNNINNNNTNNRWGSLFGQPLSSSVKSTVNRGTGGGEGGGGRGGIRTAIRPAPPNNSPGGMHTNNNINVNSNDQSAPGNNYGIGRRIQKNGAGKVNGIPKIVPINRPQDLLDFVIQDERLSVGELLAEEWHHDVSNIIELIIILSLSSSPTCFSRFAYLFLIIFSQSLRILVQNMPSL